MASTENGYVARLTGIAPGADGDMQIDTNKAAPKEIRSQAQGMLVLFTCLPASLQGGESAAAGEYNWAES